MCNKCTFGYQMKNCYFFISPSKIILFEKYYQAFVRKNTSLSVAFSIFSVFHQVMKHCVSFLIYYFKTCCYLFVEVKRNWPRMYRSFFSKVERHPFV